MKVTGPSEKGLEALIVESLVSETGYEQGRSEDYDLSLIHISEPTRPY